MWPYTSVLKRAVKTLWLLLEQMDLMWVPLVYELDDDLRPIRNYYLGDPQKVAKATQAVVDQLKKSH